MKTLLTLFICILFTIPSIAQEKQSDATWVETVEFINKYKNHINLYGFYSCESFEKISSISFENNKVLIKIDYSESKLAKIKDMKYSADLLKLESSSSQNDGCLGIEFTNKVAYEGYYMNVRLGEREYNYVKDSGYPWLKLRIDDSELLIRYEKAFKHLAYLATQKREESKKQSGDKF